MHFSNSKKASKPCKNFCLSSSDHSAGLLINTYLHRQTAGAVNTDTGVLQAVMGLEIKEYSLEI